MDELFYTAPGMSYAANGIISINTLNSSYDAFITFFASPFSSCTGSSLARVTSLSFEAHYFFSSYQTWKA